MTALKKIKTNNNFNIFIANLNKIFCINYIKKLMIMKKKIFNLKKRLKSYKLKTLIKSYNLKR